jgi:hypothetical protein
MKRYTPPMPTSPHFILPPGTQIVSRVAVRSPEGLVLHPAGAVGIIISSPLDPQHSYRVKFPNAPEASLSRHELSILKEFKNNIPILEDPLSEYDLKAHVIYRCIVGSRAYGLNDESSDFDRRGVYLPPASMHWSLHGVPEQLDYPATEECYWELQKFLVMSCKANPNILECLYSPLVEHASPLANEMLEMKQSFLSKRIYQTYSGYVASQFKKLEADLRNHGQVKWKHVMHLMRLLSSGITALREGRVRVHVGPDRDYLLSIKRGQIPWEAINTRRLELHHEFDRAYESTKLPDLPDFTRVNAFLLKARRSAVEMEP